MIDKAILAQIPFLAERYSIPDEIIYGVVMAESSGQLKATRYEAHYRWLWDIEQNKPYKGAVVDIPGGLDELEGQKTSWGPMQVMGAVAREYGFVGDFKYLNTTLGLEYGCEHLSKKIKRYGIEKGISAYNAGIPSDKNLGYVAHVLRLASEYEKTTI